MIPPDPDRGSDHGHRLSLELRQAVDVEYLLAASTAMMIGRSSDMDIVREMQHSQWGSVWDDSATELEPGQVARQYGLTQIYPVCQGADGWEQWLTSNGPMLIQVPGNAYHRIVVAGIRGGDTGEVCEPVEVHVCDPWNGEAWVE